jgi:hypothetical protein
MNKMSKNLRFVKKWYAIFTFVSCCTLMSFGKTSVPVFLLSGQSNMTGYFASINDLSADQKKTVDSVKIYMDGDGDNAKKKKWLTLGPGFGAGSSNLGPELSLGRTLSDSMPGVRIAFIKDAVGGTYLGKTEGWLPPSSNGGTGGTLYKNMMTAIDAAMKSFSTAFDTTQYTPRWAGFIWFQGEFDAYDRLYADAYEKNLTNLIKDIRAKVNVSDLPVILPMIDVQSQWTHNSIVRAADVAVSQKIENVDTMDTKGFPTDGTHYKAAGYIKIGQICAQRWIAMKFAYGGKVNTVNHHFQQYVLQKNQAFSYSVVNTYDLLGKQIGFFGTDMSRSIQTHSNHQTGIIVQQVKQMGVDECNNTQFHYQRIISNLTK